MAVSQAAVDVIARGAPVVYPERSPSAASAVSWGAIVAGAAAAAALSLILLILGSGLGLSTVSPWAHEGVGATVFGVTTILWVTFTQLVASGMGGYLAGRLRTKWMDAQADEIYFRDSAHGFLAWAVASLATAAMLTSVIGSILSSGAEAGAAVAASPMARVGNDSGATGYFVDSLFRRDATPGAAAEQGTAAPVPEVARIFASNGRMEKLPAEDVRYVGQLVAQRTGLTQQEAEKRVTDTYARMQAKLRDAETAAREDADKARKASAYAALWLFISLLAGAFVASLAATYGGRQRDA